jgi:hypothetical protein
VIDRRILIGGLLSAAAIAAVPSAASASATCSYDQASRTMNLRYAAADTNVTVTNGATLQFGKAGEPFRSCFSPTGAAATAANTDAVVIKAASGTGAAKQTTTIDEHNGDFSSSNPRLHFTILTGTGGDRLIVRETSGLDQVKLLDQTGGLAIGPAVDLDSDGDIDIRMTSGFDSVVEVDGGGSSDLLDASAATVFQAVLVGEAGNDTLKGGKKADGFSGGPGNDTIFAKDGIIEAVNGGADSDTATLDFNLDQPNSIETPKF